jgi:hypothetical protein
MYRTALLGVVLVVSAAAADDRDKDKFRKGDDIDRLARKLERDAHDMHEEVLVHFRKSPGYKDLSKHAREIERLAGRIHKLTDEKARPRQVREALNDIDEEMRHFERHVRELAREKELNRKAYDHLRDEITDLSRTMYRLRRELP